MEVHHSHHPGHKRKWHEYLLEFLMLFLAVFLGFTAENIREHKIERHREHQYVESMISDLKTDTAKINQCVRRYIVRNHELDSLLDTIKTNSRIAGYYFKPLIRTTILSLNSGYPDFVYTDGTILQLKNSGSFRLLRNRPIVDSILAYDESVKKAQLNQDKGLSVAFHRYVDQRYEFYPNRIIDSVIKAAKSRQEEPDTNFYFNHSPAALDNFYNAMHYYRRLFIIEQYEMGFLKEQAVRLIQFIRKEYHLEDD